MKKAIYFLVLISFLPTHAQENPKQKAQDSTQISVNQNSISLPDPSSIISNYTYDPETKLFYFNKKIGDYNIAYPWVLTPKKYYELILKEGIKKDFKDKNKAISGQGKDAEKLRKNLLPQFYVNSKFFESIFGGKTIDIVPRGTLGIDLGLRYSKRENPVALINNRSNLSFDFDQQINIGLKGKIGTRLNIDINYDTQSTFDFNNQIKLNYTPTEDDIIQKIEVGNVSMKSTNALITGAQSLFGAKTRLKFGKTAITAVIAEQKSGMRTIQAQGGEVIQDFEQSILQYDEYKHYFLAQYFRDHYNEALKNYPFINSPVRITRIEVWKTNRSTQTQDVRNIVAIQDLGESQKLGLDNIPAGFILQPNTPPNNAVNKFNPEEMGTANSVITPAIRDMATVSAGFGGLNVTNGVDYVSLENAIKIDSTQYKLYPQLGYITLKQRLNPDEVLGIAFEYTIGGQIYRVGEFSDNGVVYPQNIVVKLLKSNMVSTTEPSWDLMMKNIYALNAFDIKPEDFRLNILYANPTPFNYIKPVGGTQLPPDVNERILLNVFNMDRLNMQGDPQAKGDGFFDFISGITIDPLDGRIMFTSTEPFGEYLFEKLRINASEDYSDPNTWNNNQKKYVYQELYKLSKTQAEQHSAKNKFLLKGKYKTAGGDGIPIGGFNIPRGSVTVTAGGRTLVEGIDYVVNYQIGRVQIINPSIAQSKVPIQVSVEQNSIFQQTTKIFKGINVEHKFNEHFVLGGTYMSFKEKPLSWKSTYGYEPLNNTIIGFNGMYSTKLPFLTRFTNKFRSAKSDAESSISIKGDFAYLFPSLADVSDVNGRSTTYVEDFESSQMFIDLRPHYTWHLASTPARFPESQLLDNLESNKNRAKLSWYVIDQIFYSNNPPEGIDQNELSKEESRLVRITELFDQDVPSGYPLTLNPLNLVFYPKERGPYNFDTNLDANTGNLQNPQQRWGGIMRYLQTNDFEQANVEYIDFWVMDPYFNNPNPPAGGKLYMDLGYISEDILFDGHKQYENGLPGDGSNQNTISTNLARVPNKQSLVYAFTNDETERANQDVGFDGLSDSKEQAFFANYLNALPANIRAQYQNDPSADDYQNYSNAQGSIVERYRNYNGTEGNTPVNLNNNNNNSTTGSNAYPDTEDIDRDLNMNTIDSYYEYEIPIKPNISINDQYVADIKETTVPLPNGDSQTSRWIQFKIPVHNYTSVQGSISDFRSIKFMRMYLTGFTEDRVVLRFASLNLVRGDWKKYQLTLDPTDPNPDDDGTFVESSAISIEDNARRQPIPYVLPPGIEREEIYQQNSNLRQNEQSLSLKVCDLEQGDARGVYKYNSIDMRQYKNLEMFFHAESIVGNQDLQDNEAYGFIRFGSDLSDNFYEIQLPLKVTQPGTHNPEEIWPVENRMDLKLDLLTQVKLKLIKSGNSTSTLPVFYQEQDLDPSAANKPNQLKIGIKGNPNFGDVKIVMVGVRNNANYDICGEYWFNELRLSEMKNKGGWASSASIDANLSDFATISLNGGISTVGFGALEEGPLSRNLENAKRYNISTTANVGQLLPRKWNVNIPLTYTVSEEFIDPEYDPIWRDVPLEKRLDIATSKQRDSILQVAQTYTKHKGITLSGVKKNYTQNTKEKKSKKTAKHHFYDIENLTFDFSYNEIYHSDYEIKNNSDKTTRLGANYNYSFKPLSFSPFKKSKKLKKKYLRLIKDFNFNLLPSSVTVHSNINRRFNNLNFREIENYGLSIPAMQNRNYMFDWGFSVNYNPTKSIQTSYSISHNRNIQNWVMPDGTTDVNNGIWNDFFNVGTPLTHNQNLNVTYDLPLNKIPLLNFVKSTYVYNGFFQWQKSSQALEDIDGYDLGNTIQNSNSHQLNTVFDMNKLYRELGLTKLKNKLLGSNKKKRRKRTKPKPKKGDGVNPKDGKKNTNEKDIVINKGKKKRKGENDDFSTPSASQKFFGHLLEFITSLQNVKINYRQNNGLMLPGYMNSVGFFGSADPSVPFVLGWNDDNIRYEAAKRGWLTKYPDFNQPFVNNYSEEISLSGTMKPLKTLTITFKGQKSYLENISEQFNAVGGQYHALLPTKLGNFSISNMMIKTSFENISENNSTAFNRMLNNRLAIAKRLAKERGVAVPASGYPNGYGPLQSEVLMYAFVSGYSDADPKKSKLSPFRNIPIPSWRIKFSGLTRYKWFKKHFKRFSLEHNYRSDYTINQFTNNLQLSGNPNAKDANGNFYSSWIMDNLTLTEAFNPLIKVNMELKNSLQLNFEMKKDRTMSLNLNNYTLSEVSGKEYVVGLGYRIKDVKLPLTIAGRRMEFTNDLILKLDASIRNNLTVIRGISDKINQITAGQTMYNLKFTADYALTNNFSAILFYNHSFSEFAVSTSYPFTTIRGGLSIKYTFGN